jgi:RimJ/RimL family protein N-acetyltransferase
VEAADIEAFLEHQADPVASAMAAFPSRDRAAHEAHWQRVLSDPLNITRTIEVDGDVVGYLGSWLQDDRRFVGYWIGRSWWGRGYATRALTLFVDVVSDRPLYAFVAADNVASRRVLSHCGFVEIEESGPAHGVSEVLARLD